ncbi:IS3 family transposase [Pseudoclavibacter endophyticus]
MLATRGTPEGLDGLRKMTAHLRRQGPVVAHCTVDRLMRDVGMNGVRRGKEAARHHPRPGRAPGR